MARKAKPTVSPGKLILLIASIVLLVVLLSSLYPLLREKGVTGKAFAPPGQAFASCSSEKGGFVFRYNDNKNIALCSGVDNNGHECNSDYVGFIKTVTTNSGSVDVRCNANPSYQDPAFRWVECDTNANLGTSGFKWSVGEGYLFGDGKTLCAQNGEVESFFVCPSSHRISGSEGVFQDTGVVQTIKGDYLCNGGNGWKLCDESQKDKTLSETDGKSLFYCQERDGKLRWEKCSSSENNGQVTNNQIRYCDGAEWVKCDAAAKGQVSVDQKYYCEGTIWKECQVENSFSSDYKALCKGGKWSVFLQAATPPSGFSWDVPPVPQLSFEQEGVVVYNKQRKDATGTVLGGAPTGRKFYCPSTQFCPATSYQQVDNCYSENTIFPSEPSGKKPDWLCTLENNEGIWVYCNPNLPKEYKLYEEKYLCDIKGGNYLWNKCDKDKLSEDKKYYCDGTKWTPCTSSLNGGATQNENYVCSGEEWSSSFKLDSANLFEVRIQQDGDKKDISPLGSTYLCDKGTENIKFRATICYGLTEALLTVPSFTFLQGSNQPLQTKGNILFTYDEADPKSVSAHYIVRLTTEQPAFDLLTLSVVAQNFVAGRRLAVEVDGQYYLLTQVPAGPLDLSKLELVWLPSKNPVPVTVLASDTYQFEIQAKKVLQISYVADRVVIQLAKPVEAFAGQVTLHNLAAEYEVVFSRQQPVKLQDPELGGPVIVPCLSDSPSDPLTLQICLNDQVQPVATVQRDVLTDVRINNVPVAFLYHWDDATKSKRASIFSLQTLDGRKEENPLELQYEDFVGSLVDDDKRVALRFANNLYLLDHDGAILSLPALNLTSYAEEGRVTYSSGSQSEKSVEFLVDGGKITLTRQLIFPPPPFALSVKTTAELLSNPLDLAQELSTSFSSEVPVMVTAPINYGVLGQDTADVLGFKHFFKVKGDGPGQSTMPLEFQTVYPDVHAAGQTLFYYYGAEKKGGELVKTARVYLYYNLTDNVVDQHIFDATFLDTFMGEGRELALGWGNGYYLLSYAGATPTQKSFFEFEKLSLATIDGATKFTPTVSGLQASFTVPQGTITISVNKDVTTMIFAKKGAKEIAQEAATEAFAPLSDQKYVLGQGKIVAITPGEGVIGGSYAICDTGIYVEKITDKVKLCRNGELYKVLAEGEFFKDGSLLMRYTPAIEGGKTKKYVALWYGRDISPMMQFSWLSLAENFNNKQFPALLWDKEWFELSGTTPSLSDLQLKSLNGTTFCTVHA
ncbi:hypothetical protein HY496_00425, partial [Candidatus Woesearchaeota archaeon]|nr:hypothetical protein [Candidatus Woesearchaeota archaeon]